MNAKPKFQSARSLSQRVLPACCLTVASLVATSVSAEGIDVPTGYATATVMYARGSQIYRCDANPQRAGEGKWTFQAPEADLFEDGAMTKYIGRHFDGPTWESLDGGSVFGKLKSSIPSLTANSIPQLLLSAQPLTANGKFRDVTLIQRLDTVGGTVSAIECSESRYGVQIKIPYTAKYVFYRVVPSEAP